MPTVEDIFRAHDRRLRGVEPGAPESIEELERLIGRPLPRELRAYLGLAGGNPGNLSFVQTHKSIRPTIADALEAHRPRKHGARKRPERPASKIFFGDASGCQDCGPAYLILSPVADLPELEIDADDPPVGGYDYDRLQLLAPRFTAYVVSAMPAKKT